MSRQQTLADIGEFGLIDRIASIVGETGAVIGIGDDTAVVDLHTGDYLLATVDMLVEGVHFRRATIGAFELGRRALAITLSDIAAMGGSPSFALTSIAASPDTPLRFVEDLYRGIRFEGEGVGVGLIGGNTTRTAGPITLDVTLLGTVPRNEAVRRRGAQPGDALVVTGLLGEAAARRLLLDHPHLMEAGDFTEFLSRYAVPEPRISAGRDLAARHLAHAMLDISDGLASDLHHLTQASAVGAVIYEENLPISTTARSIAGLVGLNPSELALFGGEDYELLFAVAENAVDDARAAVGRLPLYVVGTVLAPEHGLLLERFGGAREPLPARGWTHF